MLNSPNNSMQRTALRAAADAERCGLKIPMSLSRLSPEELRVIGECLKAAVFGPFFDDSEFSTLMGATRSEARAVAERFPDVDTDDDGAEGNDDSWLVINNVMLNLVGYPHGQEAQWGKYISVTPEQLQRLHDRWRHT